jgi:glucokinase
MRYSIGIDLGGTNIKVVAVGQDGKLLFKTTAETGGDKAADCAQNVFRQIESVEKLMNTGATWLGLASPGLVASSGRSMAAISGHLDNLQDFDWADFLKPHRPFLLNDAHAALLGEVWKGAAQGCKDVILITLGTGVGGAFLTNGQLLRGNLGRGGHFGHMCLDIDGEPDSIGVPGTFEEAIGNRTLAKRSGGLFTSTEDLVAAFHQGDENASRVWLRSVYQLACAVSSLINIVDPEVVIIGGGIAKAGDSLFEPLAQYLDKMEWRPQGYRVSIVPAVLGSFAGAIGAAYNAIQTNKPEQTTLL